MEPDVLIAFCAVAALSWILTRFALRTAQAKGILDYPNPRSSHSSPKPRGGGVAIVLACLLSFIVLGLLARADARLLSALGIGGLAVSIAGFMDDHRSLPVSVRLTVQLGAAIAAMLFIGGLPPLQIGRETMEFGVWGYVLGVIGIAWVINLFNFMDGVDGIAASEATFIAVAGVLLERMSDVAPTISPAALALAAACLGFLAWNWPPARIFMGDVGSGFLGFCVAVLAIAAGRRHAAILFAWLVLGGFFFVDATVTLLRRLLRGEAVYEAHRTHGYQWLARRWNSHRRVTCLVIAINILWLFPWAWACLRHPEHAWWLTMVALLPIVLFVVWAGAGKAEVAS